ncbi:hypothetical protein V6615_16165 [Oscillospiraceae bacterium PP1C4]
MEPDGDGWLLDGVHYGAAPAGAGKNFIVHDLGHMLGMNKTACDCESSGKSGRMNSIGALYRL